MSIRIPQHGPMIFRPNNFGPPVSPAAQFLARVPSQGATREGHYTTLIEGLASDGIWAQLDVLYIFAAQDETTALTNLKSSSFGGTNVNSCTHTTDRHYVGGSTKRIATGYTPSTAGGAMTQNDASWWVWIRNNNLNTQYCIGATGTNATGGRPRSTSDVFQGQVCAASSGTASGSTDSTGMSGISRASSGTLKFWRNGSQLDTDKSVNSTGLSANEMWVCAANSGDFNSGQQVAMAAFGASLAGLESAFYSRINTYLVAVGAA